ncbi:metallophosphoesterase [uncultured Bosea sp.]|uniref:metallophosphoesterase n=1 Tax=uncultured Bosea sp. TaxID=211457 RepID=UPI00345BAFF8
MRLWILSDLHAEQSAPVALPEPGEEFDIAVIAGDVHGSCAAAVEWLAEAPKLQGKPVVFVPGNHEFFGSVLQDNLAAGLEAAARTGGRVHLLHRAAITIGSVRFIGCTLWTDYRLLGTPKASMVLAGDELDDHRLIRYREANGHISRFMPVNGGRIPGQRGGVKAGHWRWGAADMARAPIGALAISRCRIAQAMISPVSGSASSAVAWFCSAAAVARRRPADCLRR